MINENIEKKIDALLSEMTLEEKIGQLNQIINPIAAHDEVMEKIRRGEVGGFLTDSLYKDDETEAKVTWHLNELQRCAVEESRMGIPIIGGRDVIHAHKTCYPTGLALACTFNPELVELGYRCIAKEASNDGIHWTFSPMVDLSRDPRWGRCVEGPGEDPYLGGKMAGAAVRGFQGEDLSDHDSIAACAKHYLGYGASEGGRDYQRAEISDYAVRNYYLPSFREAVKAGVRTVMQSFNEISGEPTVTSHYYLTEILRDELGFDGFVVSDYGAVEQAVRQGVAKDRKEAAMLSINAGLDMDMTSECFLQNLKELVEEGKVSIEVLDEAVRRVLRVKFEVGLFEHPYIEKKPYDREYHASVARKISDEAIVLLKNEGGILPLDPKEPLAICGPYLDNTKDVVGAWCFDVDLNYVKSIRAGINEVSPETPLCTSGGEFYDAQTYWLRYGGDVVVMCLGESTLVSGEMGCMATIELPSEQIELINKVKRFGKKIVGVLCCGRPIALESCDHLFDAIIYAWQLGTEHGTAIADILFGKVCPSGKLSMTMPRRTGQVPIFYNPAPSGREADGYYGDSGIPNYRDCSGTPMYRFGYGLSYTEFEYSEFVCEKDKLSLNEINSGKKFKFTVNVKNIGDYAGKETVQLYIRDPYSSMTRPCRELKGFSKIHLECGETKTVTLELGADELGYYGRSGRFAVEPGEFYIYIGQDCYAEQKFTVEVTE